MKISSAYTTFLLRLIVFTAMLALATKALTFLLPQSFFSPMLPWMYLFFFSVTLIVHLINNLIITSGTRKFLQLFMLLTVGKLLLYLSIILVYALLNRKDAVPFILAFLALYICFSLFEAVPKIKRKRKQGATVPISHDSDG